MSGGWHELAPRPCSRFVVPLILNDTELIYAPDPDDANCLYKYNIVSDEWIKWFKYPETLSSKYHTTSLNEEGTILYIYNENGRVIEVDLINKTFTISKHKYHDGSHISSLVINNEFHVFGGWNDVDKSHFIWDPINKKLNKIHEFIEFDANCLRYHCTLYVKSNKSVLIINSTYSQTIYSYSILDNNCITMPIEVPDDATMNRCFVLTNDEEYILVFGAGSINHEELIYILNLRDYSTRISNIHCPLQNKVYRALIWNHNDIANCLISGYIRQFVSYLPMELLKVIETFYNNEMVHLFEIPGLGISHERKDLRHWQISVDDILS